MGLPSINGDKKLGVSWLRGSENGANQFKKLVKTNTGVDVAQGYPQRM